MTETNPKTSQKQDSRNSLGRDNQIEKISVAHEINESPLDLMSWSGGDLVSWEGGEVKRERAR